MASVAARAIAPRPGPNRARCDEMCSRVICVLPEFDVFLRVPRENHMTVNTVNRVVSIACSSVCEHRVGGLSPHDGADRSHRRADRPPGRRGPRRGQQLAPAPSRLPIPGGRQRHQPPARGPGGQVRRQALGRGCPRPVRVSTATIEGPPKTEAGIRTIALAPTVRTTLKHHRRTQNTERSTAGEAWTETGRVFTTPAGTALKPADATDTSNTSPTRPGCHRSDCTTYATAQPPSP